MKSHVLGKLGTSLQPHFTSYLQLGKVFIASIRSLTKTSSTRKSSANFQNKPIFHHLSWSVSGATFRTTITYCPPCIISGNFIMPFMSIYHIEQHTLYQLLRPSAKDFTGFSRITLLYWSACCQIVGRLNGQINTFFKEFTFTLSTLIICLHFLGSHYHLNSTLSQQLQCMFALCIALMFCNIWQCHNRWKLGQVFF